MDEMLVVAEVDAVLELDPKRSAKEAGLRYVQDDGPGIRRKKRGRGFAYLTPDGSLIQDPAERARIEALGIPPAWSAVWICPSPKGHLQATGRDEKGRKQYRYHERWQQVRNESKFGRMVAFGLALPRIREQVARDLRQRGLPREKVLATVVRLLETTLIRVGNAEYARSNKHYGLTTMRDKHVRVEGNTVRFKFEGKSGKKHLIDVRDRQLARIVKHCRDLPGYDLFQYVDETGTRQSIGSGDVNKYLRAITGQKFTAKDFRTWAGTVRAVATLRGCAPCTSANAATRTLAWAVRTVAEQLGNTPTVCRAYYIHPGVLGCFQDGTLWERLATPVEGIPEGLHADEAATMALLYCLATEE